MRMRLRVSLKAGCYLVAACAVSMWGFREYQAHQRRREEWTDTEREVRRAIRSPFLWDHAPPYYVLEREVRREFRNQLARHPDPEGVFRSIRAEFLKQEWSIIRPQDFEK